MGFNGHPPLGVNATTGGVTMRVHLTSFQRAPTLGGECYASIAIMCFHAYFGFQRAPTLGGECYKG